MCEFLYIFASLLSAASIDRFKQAPLTCLGLNNGVKQWISLKLFLLSPISEKIEGRSPKFATGLNKIIGIVQKV